MHVIATAGHVDHGKSTLVRALTGMEPDRWAEERRRGMTIDLGFAWTTLPSGAEVAFVDVPGHERFVANMLAGVGPVPAALLVVAADEGWMPQSAEHVAALRRARRPARAARGDPQRPRRPEPGAGRGPRRSSAGTSLGGVPAVAVSAGHRGRAGRAARGAGRAASPRLPAPTRAPVRLWVDRAFTIRGAGTVVTGTLRRRPVRGGRRAGAGTARAPPRRVTVRGLQSLGAAASSGSRRWPGSR